MSAQRWERMAASLTAAGFEGVKVIARPHQDGVNRSITLKVPGGIVHVADAWWRDNWAGWQTWGEGPDALSSAFHGPTKKRSEVVAAALAARDAIAPTAVTA